MQTEIYIGVVPMSLNTLKGMVPYKLRKRIYDLIPKKKQGVAAVLDHVDRNISTIFDIGANIGDISLYMLRRFPGATVHSFEPCSATYASLLENLRIADYGERAQPHRLGFYDQEMQGRLNISSFHGANSMLELSEEYREMNPQIVNLDTEEIPLVRLDDFVRVQNIDHIDLVKIDVEGVERQVLLGGRETFSTKVDTVLMEISFVKHPRETGEYLNLLQLMHEYGFAPSEIYDIAHSDHEQMWRLAQIDCVFRRY
jgi:FkbM family methyltransferase